MLSLGNNEEIPVSGVVFIERIEIHEGKFSEALEKASSDTTEQEPQVQKKAEVPQELTRIFSFDSINTVTRISHVTELFGDNVQEVLDRIDAVKEAGSSYNTFTKRPVGSTGGIQ